MCIRDRIQEIEAEALAALEEAGTTAEIEEVRVKYPGRKAELTLILRGISDLEPAERGPVGGKSAGAGLGEGDGLGIAPSAGALPGMGAGGGGGRFSQ